MQISISECIKVWSCSCKGYSKAMQFLATSPNYNPTTYTSSESLKNIFSTASHLAIIKKTFTNQVVDDRNYFQFCCKHISLHVYTAALSLG